MEESNQLTQRVLAEVLSYTEDSQKVLVELGARLEPYADELVEAWIRAYTETAVREPLPPGAIVRGIQEEAVHHLIDGLRSGDLRVYFDGFATWGRQLALSGLSFDGVLRLLREYQRAGLPVLLKVYTAGPELQLVLSALDDLYHGTVGMIGAAYIEMMQTQLAHSARWRSVGLLAGGVAHSLNNVLAAIIGRAQLLNQYVRDEAALTELNEIQMAALASAANLRRLQDFLRVSRDARLIETDVNVAMREAAELTRYVWRDEAEAQGILIDVVKDLADVPLVMAYSSLLREMVVELIFNAIEAMPQGGLITLRTERKDDQVLMAVTDTGEGMPDAVQLRVFDAFFTTKGPTHPGLGLNNVQNIAKRHNATITLTSSPGRGSTFTISLPMAPSVVPEAPALPRAEQPARILLIDDESVIRDITAKILTLRGHQLNVYDNGAEGVRAFSQPGAFDIVITDLGMPGMSGWEVARAIKEIDPKVLVVLMTGWAAELDPQKVREGGVDRVLNKPFDVDQVLALVNEAVTLRDRM